MTLSRSHRSSLFATALTVLMVFSLAACTEDTTETMDDSTMTDTETVSEETGFVSWDLDGNSKLGQNEFYDGAYGFFDADSNGYINEDEYDDTWSYWRA